MEYIITNGRQHVQSTTNGLTLIDNIDNSTRFAKEKAMKVHAHLPRIWKKFHLQVKSAPAYTNVEVITYTNIDSLTDLTKVFFRRRSDSIQ